jgi:hypothetical protein
MVAARNSPWVLSLWWDGFWMFSAYWATGLLLIGSLFVPLAAMAATLFAVNRFIALTHSWSTTYMVLLSPLFAETRRKNWVRYRALPAGIVVLSLALGVSIARTMSQTQPLGTPQFPAWLLYLGLFWVGHFWHFGNQDFGVLSIYRHRANQQAPWDRRVDRVATIVLMYIVHPIAYLSVFTTSPLTESFVAAWPGVRTWVHTATPIALCLVVPLAIVLIGQELRKSTCSVPKLAYYVVILSHPLLVIYAFPAGLGAVYVTAYLWSHWLIATGLVAKVNSTHYAQEKLRYPWTRHITVLGLMAVGIWMLTENSAHLNIFSAVDYKQVLRNIGPAGQTAGGLFLGFFLAEQLLHYHCDRCLFRFRDPDVRGTVAPLLTA